MMIIKGVNVFPTQIESVLVGMPYIGPHYPVSYTHLQSSTVLNTSSYKPYAERVNVGTGGSTPEPEPTPEETTAEPTPEETTTKAPEPTTAEPTTKAPETTAPTTTAAAKN